MPFTQSVATVSFVKYTIRNEHTIIWRFVRETRPNPDLDSEFVFFKLATNLYLNDQMEKTEVCDALLLSR